jgi:hypothetical protein
MKKSILSALAIAGFAAMSNAGAAQLTDITSYSAGDMLIGITSSGASASSPGASQNLIINIGSNLNALNGGYFDISSALNSNFGTNWATLSGGSQLKWGLISASYNGDDDIYTAFASTPFNNSSVTLGTDPFNYNSFGALANMVDNVATGFTSGSKAGGASFIAAANSSSWTKGGTLDGTPDDAFGFFAGGVTSLYSPNAGNGQNWLDVYTTVNGGGNSTFSYVNTIGLESNGKITVVPEPSTYALIGFGALLLIVAYRRSNA